MPRERRAHRIPEAVRISLPEGENVTDWADVDFDAIVAEAWRARSCAECGAHLHYKLVPRSVFCSDRCRYRFRDRRRLVKDPERERARSKSYYWRNREMVLAKAAAKRRERAEGSA